MLRFSLAARGLNTQKHQRDKHWFIRSKQMQAEAGVRHCPGHGGFTNMVPIIKEPTVSEAEAGMDVDIV